MDQQKNSKERVESHKDQSYKILMTKMAQLITRNSKHVKVTPITSELYLRDQP